MTVQPKHHWQFKEREGAIAKDAISGAEGRLINHTTFRRHGRIGPAIGMISKKSRVQFDSGVGQFGISDFTIAFGMNITNLFKQTTLDIIGNRSVNGHGNWFSLRVNDRQRLRFEVDENSKAKNYILAQTDRILRTFNWVHVAVVREGTTLRIYVDGVLMAENSLPPTQFPPRNPLEQRPGVANINNGVDLRLGDYRQESPGVYYEDLRIYHTALNDVQIQNLVPPLKRLLRPGQIELIDTDGAAVVFKEDVADLSRFSPNFQKLRLGPDTGVTLYREANFGSTAQKLYTDIPEIKLTKLGAFPRSVHIWSSVGEPFTGKWIIGTPNGRYLSRNQHTLTTAPGHAADELFVFHYNPDLDKPLLIPVTNQGISLLKVDDKAAVLVVDDSESHKDAFSIMNTTQTQWLRLNQNNTFSWTQQHDERAIFHRVAKIADNEGQVGELSMGEVALYEHIGYRGRTWVLSDSKHNGTGNFTSLRSFQGLDNRVSSIRLGPQTGVTVFANENQTVREAKRETDVEDFVTDVPDFRNGKTQVGNDTISSLKIFRTVAQEEIFTSVTSKLSQDYRLVNDELEEFSSYRTILRLTSGVEEIEVSATDLTTIEVEDTLYEIDEVRSVTLRPNGLRQIMITSEADGISTPGLKFRTSDLSENEQVVIFPHQGVHQQITELEDDALWNATDAQGNSIVDQNKHTRSEIASVQNTIKRTMATVVTTEDDAAPSSTVKPVNGLNRVVSTKQVVSAETIDNPWTLNFQARPTGAIPGGSGSAGLVQASPNIWEEPVEQTNFEQLYAQAEIGIQPNKSTGKNNLEGNVAALRIGGFFGSIGDAVKGAVNVTIGAFKGALNAIIDIGGRIVRFVLDTAKKVADFVTAVVEKVVESIKQFIEFLRFLFEWDDILATQRYLVNTINAAFDSAEHLVASAKPHISGFIGDLQQDIADGIDNMIRSLGVDPAADEDDGPQLPEAAEWLLNKIFGGSKSSDSKTVPNTQTGSDDVSQGSPIEQALARFLAALKGIGTIGAEVFEGLFETIEALLKNPLRPELALAEILEAFKEVSISILDFAENLVLGMLDLVVAVIDLLQDLLNAEIRIPFISELFKLLGAGKLTILNLTSLLVAVPTTALSKLIFGEAPFQNLALPKMPQQPAVATPLTLTAVQSENAPANLSAPTFDRESTRRKVLGFGIMAISADLLNGLITTFLDLIPEPDGTSEPFNPDENFVIAFFETTSLLMSCISWLASFPSSEIEPGGYPYNILKEENRVLPVTDDNRQLFRERLLWGYRTIIMGLDIALLGYAHFSDRFPSVPKINSIERMKRAIPSTIYFTSFTTVVDLALTSLFLAREDDRGLKIAHEVIGLTPGIFGPLRLVPSKNPKARAVAYLTLAGMNTVATFSNLGFGIKFLADDVRALNGTALA